MPSAITAPVEAGTLTTLEDFALRCARQCGALLFMRDASLDTPIPPEVKPDAFYDKWLGESRQELARLEGMTPVEQEAAYRKEQEACTKTNRRMRHDNDEVETRYRLLRAKVEAWSPPTVEHTNLKTIMLEQIDQSLRFDCGDYRVPIPSGGAAEWHQKRVDIARDLVQDRIKSRDDAYARAAECTKWLVELRESVRGK